MSVFRHHSRLRWFGAVGIPADDGKMSENANKSGRPHPARCMQEKGQETEMTTKATQYQPCSARHNPLVYCAVCRGLHLRVDLARSGKPFSGSGRSTRKEGTGG